jgi:hypothetical protein
MEYKVIAERLYDAIVEGRKYSAKVLLEDLLERVAEEKETNWGRNFAPLTLSITPEKVFRNTQLETPTETPVYTPMNTPPITPPNEEAEINIGAETPSLPREITIQKTSIKGKERAHTTEEIDLTPPREEEFNYEPTEETSWFQEVEATQTPTISYAEAARGPNNTVKRKVSWSNKLENYETQPSSSSNHINNKRFRKAGHQDNLGKQNYSCGCNSWKLKEKYQEWEIWKGKEALRGYDCHCCRCKRPGKASQIFEGNEQFYQMCGKCLKWENYNEQDEAWWGRPCPTCELPMEEAHNIHGSLNACSQACKYAYLAVHSAKSYAHIAQRIAHYKDSSRTNCNEPFSTVAALARFHYSRLYPNEILDDEERAFHNTPSFSEQYSRYWEDLRIERYNFFDEHAVMNNNEHQQYISALNNSMEENREAILEKLSHMVDLTIADKIRFGAGGINLCHECLMPYNSDELAKEGIKLLCTRENPGEKSCHKAYLETITPKEAPKSAWDE